MPISLQKKVNDKVSTTALDQNVYNGKRDIRAQCEMFMSRENIKECVVNIKIKNIEGYDRIPQRILVDEKVQLIGSGVLC